VTYVKTAPLLLVAVLVAGCASTAPHPAPSATAQYPSQSRTPSLSSGCTVSAARGSCGPYTEYASIIGTTSATNIGNNVWNPINGWKQTLYSVNPGHWSVTANMPAGNTAVVSYPSVGANYGQVSGHAEPLSDFRSLHSSFRETMNANSRTSAWAAYDIWLGPSSGSKATDEVMIQHDFANNGACTAEASATFGGSGGVPVQKWNLCQFGRELVWKLTGGNEKSGTVNILAMLHWLVAHRYMAKDTGLFSIGYGWEICSTGGQNETFEVKNFSITAEY
jgi:hypothetical protein